MEQLVARWAHNPKVVGSSPAPATQISQRNYSSGFFYTLKTLYDYVPKKKKAG